MWRPSHPVVAPCDALAAAVAARDDAYDVGAATLLAALIDFAERELAARKVTQGIRFYDDLLTALARALDDPVRGASLADNVRRRYPAALIDEFGHRPVQYEVVRRLRRHVSGRAGRRSEANHHSFWRRRLELPARATKGAGCQT